MENQFLTFPSNFHISSQDRAMIFQPDSVSVSFSKRFHLLSERHLQKKNSNNNQVEFS